MSETALSNEKRSSGFRNYLNSLKYMWHVIFRPFDGFWDLVHERRGTIAAGTTYLVLFLITRVIELMFTSFQFVNAPLQYINIFEQCASLLLPFLIICVSNWSLTTLFDGKGRFRDIYMALCYALAPLVLIRLPLVLVSNMIAVDEGSFYYVLESFSLVWTGFLAFVALMQVHDYGPGKTIIFIVATVIGAAVIIFLILVFFSLLSDALGFFISIVREIMYRLY